MSFKYIYFILLCIILSSCAVNKQLSYFKEEKKPTGNFVIADDFELDYSDYSNWAFYEDGDKYLKLLPKNIDASQNEKYNIDVFYIHPTTLYSSDSWNADTSFFKNDQLIPFCIKNQASVFAGLCNIYAPHYRQMHIHSYSDTVNGYKAYDFAYTDVLNAFKYFMLNISKGDFIIASHSQGTNHAMRLIEEYISMDKQIFDRLVLSYLIGMEVKSDFAIPMCSKPDQLNCVITWRTFNNLYYPEDWNYGDNFYAVNPLSFNVDSNWVDRSNHKGVLMPNSKILFHKNIQARTNLGMLWVNMKKNSFLKKYSRDDYHMADYNLFWLNMRDNLNYRLSKFN